MIGRSVCAKFYLGSIHASSGHTIDQIRKFDTDEFDWHHDFIQWLFPLSSQSVFNPDAPLLNDEAIEEFKRSPMLQREVMYSLDWALGFYGLERVGSEIVLGESFDEKRDYWLHEDSHHHLRLSRITKSLSLLGLSELASALHTRLMAIAHEASDDEVSVETKEIWGTLLEDH